MTRLRVAACQLDVTVGDLDGNAERIVGALERAEDAGADVAVFSELAICGYPPEDLLLKPSFVADCRTALDKVAGRTGRCAAVVGFPDAGRDLHNAAAVLAHGQVQAVYHKRILPNHAVFDERRYFAPGDAATSLVSVGDVRIGVSICEDAWAPNGPINEQAAAGAEVVLNLNASPYHRAKAEVRARLIGMRAADASCAIVYVNQVCGQDELVFDGNSMVFDVEGTMIARSPQFVEDLLVCDLEVGTQWRKRLLDPRGRDRAPLAPVVQVAAAPAVRDRAVARRCAPDLSDEEEVYRALVLGTADYARKNRFSDVVLGLSGGIDSSLVTVIAADALGAENVHAISLPSRFSSDHSRTDATELCRRLGVELRTIEIEPAHVATLDMLSESFAGTERGVAEENIQGRIRAVVLMALANKFPGWLTLVCGNKSELAVGYTTVYGVDMAGGFAPLRDVLKTDVYRLARWRNGHDLSGPLQPSSGPIPDSVLDKPPSAELSPGQLDADNLPAYEELDAILSRYVESDWTAGDLEAAGFDPALVARITRLVDVAEWKRRQAPVGVRVTAKAFGKDRRLPITNAYRG